MEHIAKDLHKDPTEVKMANRRAGDLPFPALVDDLRRSSDFDKRLQDVQLFNKVESIYCTSNIECRYTGGIVIISTTIGII